MYIKGEYDGNITCSCVKIEKVRPVETILKGGGGKGE
jgi:hypothetical protein